MTLARLSAALILTVYSLASGCDEARQLAPVYGKVLYNGQPLTHGVVMFQPSSGPPARGRIGPDGSFELQMIGVGMGAPLGVCKVRVSSREPSPPGDAEVGLGRLLIPQRYIDFNSSGIQVEVEPGRTEPYLIELAD